MSKQEDLEIPVGAISIGEMMSDLDDEDFPARISVPACLTFDAKTKDEAIAYLAELWEGWDAETTVGRDDDHICFDRIYVGWGISKAYVEDAPIADDW